MDDPPRRLLTRATPAARGLGALVRAGHHRLPPVDLLVAAIPDRFALGLLHYDGDYDVIAEKTDLRFGSEWRVPRGTV